MKPEEQMFTNSAREPESHSERDEMFYFEHLTFLVENRLYKVPRYYFMKSLVFRDMFNLPVPEATSADGFSDYQPLRLDGIKKDDFKQLLRLMFPSRVCESDNLTCAEWMSVLRLATMWEFKELREKAIVVLSKLQIEPITQIGLARECHVSQWLIPCLNRWAQGEEPLTVWDVNSLGVEFVLKMAQLRDCVKLRDPLVPCSNCQGNRTQPSNYFSQPIQTSPFVFQSTSVFGVPTNNPTTRISTNPRSDYDFTSDIKRVFAEDLKHLE